MASPDGFQKEVILVNGQFPGPIIEANWYVGLTLSRLPLLSLSRGDWIEGKNTSTVY
jgi:hypothetical protein